MSYTSSFSFSYCKLSNPWISQIEEMKTIYNRDTIQRTYTILDSLLNPSHNEISHKNGKITIIYDEPEIFSNKDNSIHLKWSNCNVWCDITSTNIIINDKYECTLNSAEDILKKIVKYYINNHT